MAPPTNTAVVAASPPILDPTDTIALYGDTGDGKTALIGELAEKIYTDTRKKTLLYSADRGGWLTVQPYVTLGIIDVVPLTGDPWVWLDKVIQGFVPGDAGKWIMASKADYGLFAFESATSVADELMNWLSHETAKGKSFGEGGVKFAVGSGTDTLNIGGNGRSHYQIVQKHIMDKVWQSQSIGGPVIWTFAARRATDEDANTTGQVLGPQVAGKALTAEIPRWFKYTFHVMAEPQLNAAPKHILYLEDHQSQSAGMAKGLGNPRNPLVGATEFPVAFSIEPASIVQALTSLKKRQFGAIDLIRKRVGL